MSYEEKVEKTNKLLRELDHALMGNDTNLTVRRLFRFLLKDYRPDYLRDRLTVAIMEHEENADL